MADLFRGFRAGEHHHCQVEHLGCDALPTAPPEFSLLLDEIAGGRSFEA
jgi:hypothetical protein